jgi:RNA polymerase sigma-70 factor (ECF subfamily)
MEPADGTAALVRAAKSGDREAMETLFLAFYPRVLRVAAVRLGKRMRPLLDASDVAQSVFGRAYRGLPRFEDRGPGSFGAWLEEIVERTIREKVRWFAAEKRGAGRRPPAPLSGSGPASSSRSPSKAAEKEEEIERLYEAMRVLTAHERRIVETRLLLGLKGAEAAEALGMSEAAVRQTYARAMEKMGRHMAGKPGSPS